MFASSTAATKPHDDYPEATRAEFVSGCLIANGASEETLDRCTCAISVIATLLTYDEYRQGEAAIASGATLPKRFGTKRGNVLQRSRENLLRAQLEAEVRCF